jgi:uroporphyrinogen decarboxylase
MTPRERWLAAIDRRPADRVPTDFWSTEEVERSLVKHLRADSMEAVCERLHIDKPFAIEARYVGPPLDPGTDAYGCVTRWVEHGTGGYDEVVHNPLADYETVEEIEANYTWPVADWWDVDDVSERLRAAGERPVQIMMAGVYTDYTKLRGMEQAFIDFAMNHDIVEYCLGKMYALSEERTVRVLEAAERRVDVGWIFHDLGSQQAMLVSPATFRKLLLPGIARLAVVARQAGVRVCLHSDGAIREAIPDLLDAGVQVLNPIQWRCEGMDRRGLVEEFGDRVTFHGALDNQETLASNDEARVRAEVRENIDILAGRNGYILAPCHNAQPVTRPETIVAMYDEAYHYGRR